MGRRFEPVWAHEFYLKTAKTLEGDYLEKHYAPNARVILDAQASEGEGFIAPANVATPPGAIRLASPTNTDEYARTLYSALRDGDAQGLETIAIIQPSGDGLAIAIRDRLMRASKGR